MYYKRDWKSKGVEKGKGSVETLLTEGKPSQDEKGYVYLASTSTPSNHDPWLIDSSASYHMMMHREWLWKYEKFGVGDVLLGYDSLTNIVGWDKVWLLLKYGRRKTVPGVLHVPRLVSNLIFVSKMGDARVNIVFEKDSCKMVWGAMVLMTGVCVREGLISIKNIKIEKKGLEEM